MGVSPAIFESAGVRTEHYVPGSYSRSNNVTSPSGVSAGNLVIMGDSNGGEPCKLLEFGSLADAKETLLGGKLLDGVGYAFNGSTRFIPQRVYAMRVNNGTQSELVMKTGSTELLKLKSWDWGVHTNLLKAWVMDGTNKGKRVSVSYKTDSVDIDDIEKPSISIEYIGSGESPICTIDKTSISLSATVEEETGQDAVTASFASFPTLAALATYINDSGYYIAEVLDGTLNAKSNELDTVSASPLSDATVFCSNMAAFIDALKSIKFINSVEILTDTVRSVPDNDDGYKYFTGGTQGSYTTTQWIDALEALETEDVQIIATPETTETILQLIAAHCSSMSTTVNKKERCCILGANANETDDNGIATAISFNSKRVSYVIDSGTKVNPVTGNTETVSGSIIACMIAGMESAAAVNMPMTFKTISLLSVSKRRTIPNMEKLIKAGILVVNNNPENLNEIVCIRAITTFQGNDLISSEMSMTREDDYMNRDLRSRYAGSIGGVNNPSEDEIISTLKQAAAEWFRQGYIVKNGSDNVWNISVRFSGDKVYLTYCRYLMAPRNFVFQTATNLVYETTVEL